MKLIFCFPGNTFTDGFLWSWTATEAYCLKHDIEFVLARGYQSSVFHCRNDIVFTGNDGVPTRKSRPFGGREYDYCLWIDSDTVWSVKDFLAILGTEKDIISGLVPMNPEGAIACGLVNNFNPVIYLKGAAVDQLETDEAGLIEIDFCGFAFVAIRRGVFESMEYPWFRPELRETPNGLIFPGEDFGWCLRAKELGYRIFAHTKIKLGHQKTVTLGYDPRCGSSPSAT